jgi:hypothetical protein
MGELKIMFPFQQFDGEGKIDFAGWRQGIFYISPTNGAVRLTLIGS